MTPAHAITWGDVLTCAILSILRGAIDGAKRPGGPAGAGLDRDLPWERLQFAAWLDAGRAADGAIGAHAPNLNARGRNVGISW